jgi:hypothetical protein
MKQILKKAKSFLPLRIQVVQGVKEVQIADSNFNKTAITNQVRALTLPSPITEWEEGYNEAVEDAVNIIMRKWEWEK